MVSAAGSGITLAHAQRVNYIVCTVFHCGKKICYQQTVTGIYNIGNWKHSADDIASYRNQFQQNSFLNRIDKSEICSIVNMEI